MQHPARSWLRALVLVLLTAIPVDVLAQGAGSPGPPLSAEEEASLQEIRDFVQATGPSCQFAVGAMRRRSARSNSRGSLRTSVMAPVTLARFASIAS